MENINEGKTKVIESISEHLVKITTKDVLTAFDSIKKDELDVGKDKTKQACEVFKYLEKHGVATPFVEQVDDTSFIAKKCDMLPYECVIRRRAYGSFLTRNPAISDSTYFHSPIKEFFHKHSIIVENDSSNNRMMPESQARWSFLSEDGQWTANVITDPFICFDWSAWAEHGNMDDKTGFKIDVYSPRNPFISSNKLLTIDSAITPNEYNQINHLMLNTFEHIEKAWKKLGAELIDMKIEVGYDSETGNLMIADVVDNDSWRVWWNGDKTEQLDKQSYRDGESIDTVLDKYHRVTEYVSKFND